MNFLRIITIAITSIMLITTIPIQTSVSIIAIITIPIIVIILLIFVYTIHVMISSGLSILFRIAWVKQEDLLQS